MSLNRWATMAIGTIVQGKAFSDSLLKDPLLKGYVSNGLLKKTFSEINGDYQLSVETKQTERVHGDAKSKFQSKYCMSIASVRAPAQEGGGYRRVIGLHKGDKAIKDTLIVKAEFGDGPIDNPSSDVITGLMFRTALLMLLKKAKFEGFQSINPNDLPADPEA